MFRFLGQLSVKTKLILMVLIISLGSALVIGYLSLEISRQALSDAATQRLANIRTEKALQIETYFQRLHDQIEILSEDETAIGAMVRFNKSFRELNHELIQQEQDTSLQAYYQDEYFPQLAPHVAGELSFDIYRPTSQAAHYLQYHYISNNPFSPSEKLELINAEDGSEYSLFHERYHKVFRSLVQKFGYHDLFLIDFETQEVIYSVSKKVDLGTSLIDGPYAQSGLSEVIKRVRARPEIGAVQIIDYQPYTPSSENLEAFIAAPIHNGPHIVGILAAQLPMDEIDRILNNNQQWEETGLGRSGETYLVGPDFRLRSNPRLLIEDPAAYLTRERARGLPTEAATKVEQFNTAILLQQRDTPATRAALNGEAGERIIRVSGHPPILSTYQPLNLPGLNWVIITEMEEGEVLQPVLAQQRAILTAMGILAVVVTILTIILSYSFVRPMDRLVASAHEVEAGEKSLISVKSKDEFGSLADTMNSIISKFRDENKLIARQHEQHDAMLTSLVPEAILERVGRGEDRLVEEINAVTVMMIRVLGFTEFSDRQDTEEGARLMDEWNQNLNALAEKHDLDRIEIVGESFMVSCGLSKPYLDHVKRTLDYGLDTFRMAERFNERNQTHLSLVAGVETGHMTIGIINTTSFEYDLWGQTLNVASDLMVAAPRNTILVSPSVYERRKDLFAFKKFDRVHLMDITENLYIDAWVLESHNPSSTEPEDLTEDSIVLLNKRVKDIATDNDDE